MENTEVKKGAMTSWQKKKIKKKKKKKKERKKTVGGFGSFSHVMPAKEIGMLLLGSNHFL